jgi:hypothetical protein
MRQRVRLLAWSVGLVTGLILAGPAARGQESYSPSQPAPSEAPIRQTNASATLLPMPQAMPQGPCSTCGQEHCHPACNLNWVLVRYGVKNSFEVYARFGPAFITSGGNLDDLLHTGWAADFAVRTFLYRDDRLSGWYGELGGDYVFNDANANIPAIERSVNVDIVQNLGTFFQTTNTVPARDILGMTELHRAYGRIGAGYQRYWWADSPWGMHGYLDLNAGLRLGHAHASLTLLERQFLQDIRIREGDLVLTQGQLRATDFIKNFYVGGGIGMLIPYCGYEATVGLHWEYSHDIIRLPTLQERDDGLDQAKVQILAGVRW